MSSSKQRQVLFKARWSDESWELTVSPDDSASDILNELQRKTRSRQTSDMCIYIDEESNNSSPSFRRLEADEKVIRAILMCVANPNPSLFIAPRASVNVQVFAPSIDAFKPCAVAIFEHSSVDDVLRRAFMANASLSSSAKSGFALVKELYPTAAAADAGKSPGQRIVMNKSSLAMFEKRISETDSWVVRFVVEPAAPSSKAPTAPTAAAPEPPVKSPTKEKSKRDKLERSEKSSRKEKAAEQSDEKSEKSEKSEKPEKREKLEKSSKSSRKEKEAAEQSEEASVSEKSEKAAKPEKAGKSKSTHKKSRDKDKPAEMQRSVTATPKITSVPSRRTLQKHADAVKSGNATASDLVDIAAKSIPRSKTDAAAAATTAGNAGADESLLEKAREQLREQEAELERLRDAPSADEWRKLLDKRVSSLEVEYNGRLSAAQAETDVATSSLEIAQKREREAQRQVDQMSEQLSEAQAVLERERESTKRDRDDAVAQVLAQLNTVVRERDLNKSQLEIERDALQSQVVSLQQRIAKQAVDVSQARAELTEKETLLAVSEKQQSTAANDARALRLDLTTAREQIEQLQSQVAQAGDVAALKATIAEQRAIAAKLQEQTEGGDQIAALHAQLEEQRAIVKRSMLDHREQQRRDQDEIAHLRDALASRSAAAPKSGIEAELVQLRAELVESESQCEKYAELLQKARKQYDAEFDRLAELDTLQVRVDAAEGEKRRLEQLLRDADSTTTLNATRHLARVDELRGELNARAAELEAANDDLTQIKQTCAAASDLARDRKQELDARRDESYKAAEQLKSVSQTNDELTRRFLQLQNMCAEQENQLNDMRGRLASVIATRRDVVADANGKAPKSGNKSIEYWKSSFENEVLTRTSLEVLLAEKASSVFAAEGAAASSQQQVAMLEESMSELRKQLIKAQSEQARLADGFVTNTSDAAAAVEQLRRERDEFRAKWHRAVQNRSSNNNTNAANDDDSGSYSESYEDEEEESDQK